MNSALNIQLKKLMTAVPVSVARTMGDLSTTQAHGDRVRAVPEDGGRLPSVSYSATGSAAAAVSPTAGSAGSAGSHSPSAPVTHSLGPASQSRTAMNSM